MAVKYADILERRQSSDQSRRKGERTRDRLKLAAVQLLDEVGYRDMRVADICKRAGVSAATFYLYYKNKSQITVETLTEFLETVFGAAQADGPYASAFEAIYRTNLGWIATVRANAGLLRCLMQVGDETPEFATLNQKANYDWYLKVSGSLRRSPRTDEDTALMVAYSLGSMIDELCRRLYVAQDPHLVDLVARLAASDEELAEFTAVLWHRAAYACDPSEVRTKPGRKLVQLAAALNAPAARPRRTKASLK